MKIDHIALAVESLDEALRSFKSIWGVEPDHVERIESDEVTEAMIPIGETHIQLLESTKADSTIARFIEHRGQGLHHIAIQVDDLEAAMERVRAGGGTLIDETPRRGGGDSRVAFVHPSSTSGVLIELVQR